MQFLITTTFAVISLVGVASPCPRVCSCTGFPQGPIVNCSNRGLITIPNGIPSNTYVLDLSGNSITRVEAWFFSDMPNISAIDMSDNIISFVSEEAFQKIPWQTDLYIKMFCGCNDNLPLWKWLRVTEKFMSSMSCYDYHSSRMFDLQPRDFYECSEARSTPSTTTSRTTATPACRTTVTRVVIGIAIGAGSLAGVIVLLFVIWRLWIRSKDKEDKFEQQQDKINSVILAIPPSTFPQRPTEKSQYII